MTLKLYNTFTRRKQVFRPLRGAIVRMYSCGPTVYADAHLGNFRSFLFADFLRRVLEYNGYRVRQVMNITDVGHLTSDADTGDDKVERAAARAGISARDIVRRYTSAFRRDRAALNILTPNVEPKATGHIAEQVALIRRLERGGYAYATSNGVYFDTAKFPAYGRLSRQQLRDKRAGARVPARGGKRHPADFALWKLSPPGAKRQMEWDSPWGVGFPGWHVECSAMSRKYLGQPFDIHTGGIDHLPVHHENEIAQSAAAYGKPLARYWLHGEFLVLGRPGQERRMGKSERNPMTIRELAERGIEPLAFRYLCLTTHYRKKLYLTTAGLAAAAQGLRRLRQAAQGLPAPRKRGAARAEQRFLAAVNDDLNLPRALATVWDLLRSRRDAPAEQARTLVRFDAVLGLNLAQVPAAGQLAPLAVRRLVAEREAARRSRDWRRADELRQQVRELGYAIDDTTQGPRLKPT